MTHDVEVNGGELWSVMKTPGDLAGPDPIGDVVLTGTNGFLTLHYPGIVLELAAPGTWDASVRVRRDEIAELVEAAVQRKHAGDERFARDDD